MSLKELCLSAESGSLDCLQYAHQKGCPYDGGHGPLAKSAVRGGSIQCLQYVIETMACSWMGTECCLAFLKGDFVSLKYAHEKGCRLLVQFGSEAEKVEWMQSNGRDNKSGCMLYVHCHGRCFHPSVWLSPVGKLALEKLSAWRRHLKLCFLMEGWRAARQGRQAAFEAHRLMYSLPHHVVDAIVAAARLAPL